MADTKTSYRVSIGYTTLAEKEKTLSYPDVKEEITQATATAVTKALLERGDDIFQNGVASVDSIVHVKTTTVTTAFAPYEEAGE